MASERSAGAARAVRVAFALGALLAAPRALHAEPSAAQKETARTLMAEGRELREQHDLKGALARFQAADAMMNVPTTGLELARAQADLNLLVEARTTIRRLLSLPARDGEPAPFQEARSKAESLDAELETRIASLRLVLQQPTPGELTRITIDGDAVAIAAVGMSYRVNPGHHRVAARAANGSAEAEVDVGEHELADVTLEFHVDAASETPALSTGPTSGGSAMPTVTYVAGGIGIAGLIVGGVTGALALSSKHAAEAGCVNERCPPSTWSDLDRAHSYATISTVGFIVGAVGIGVGIGSFLMARPASAAASGAPSLRANVSFANQASSLSLSGRF